MLTVLVVDCAANRGPKSLGHPVNEHFSAFQFNSLGFPIAAAKTCYRNAVATSARSSHMSTGRKVVALTRESSCDGALSEPTPPTSYTAQRFIPSIVQRRSPLSAIDRHGSSVIASADAAILFR